ncbi:MAG: hypothetical protein ACLRNQ_10350 [Flavonifractor plautii]
MICLLDAAISLVIMRVILAIMGIRQILTILTLFMFFMREKSSLFVNVLLAVLWYPTLPVSK